MITSESSALTSVETHRRTDGVMFKGTASLDGLPNLLQLWRDGFALSFGHCAEESAHDFDRVLCEWQKLTDGRDSAGLD